MITISIQHDLTIGKPESPDPRAGSLCFTRHDAPGAICGLLLVACCLFWSFAAIAQPQPGSKDYLATSLQFILQNSPQPVPSAQISATRLDNPGSCSYVYWVVARFVVGNAQPAGPAVISNGTCSLVNGNSINWGSVTGATSYDVLRTTGTFPPSGACGCAVATNVTSLTTLDSGTLSAYTVNTFQPSSVSCLLSFLGTSTNTASLNFAGCPITNSSIANPFVIVDSVTCQLGGPSCTIPTGANPGGSPTQIQFQQNATTFGGVPNFNWVAGSNQVQSIGLDNTFAIFLQGTGTTPPSCTLGKGPISCVNINGTAAAFTADSTGTSTTAVSIGVSDISGTPGSLTGLSVVASGAANLTGTSTQITATGSSQAIANDVQSGLQAAGNLGVGWHVARQGAGSNTTYSFAADADPAVFPGLMTGVRSITASVSQTRSDSFFQCDATAGNVTITLLATPPNYSNNPTGTATAGMILAVKKIDATANTCIIAGNGNNIDGSSTLTLHAQNQAAIIQWSPVGTSQWNIIAEFTNRLTLTGNTCTTAGVLNNACGTTITTPFPDANFHVLCNLETQLSGGAAVITGTGSRTVVAGSGVFVLEIQNLGANAVATQYTYECTAWEDLK